ncbi:type II toxin-antitoxin system VapC family toxin [Leptothrix sp. BB-4]
MPAVRRTLLLDTHAFLWWVSDHPSLSATARSAIADADNDCLLSVASCWEMAIKISLGKLQLSSRLDRFLPEQLAANQFRLHPIDLRHTLRVAQLPWHHRDPFDRLMLAQCAEDGLILVSADTTLQAYGLDVLW